MKMTRSTVSCHAIITSLIASFFGLTSQYVAQADDAHPSAQSGTSLSNSELAHSAGAERHVSDWTFESVELVYEEEMGFVHPRIQSQGDATCRLTSEGKGVTIEGKTEIARGDFVSSPLTLDAFRRLHVTVEYVVESGDPLVLACLRPTHDRSLVDSAFLPTTTGQRRRETAALHSGRTEGEYSVSVSVVGVGSVRLLSVSAERGEKLRTPDKPVVVVDLMHPKPLAEGPYGWKNVQKLVDVLGFSRIAFIHPLEVTSAKLAMIDPAIIVLSPTSEEMMRADPREMDIDRYLAGVRRAAEFGVPVVGICAGHHLLAMAHGGRAGAVVGQGPDGLRELHEWGPTELTATTQDTAFAGLPRFPNFRLVEAHSRVVHSSFTMPKNLASSEICALQVFRYPDRPWYTFQGHIESDWEYACPEAYLIWKNLLGSWGLGL